MSFSEEDKSAGMFINCGGQGPCPRPLYLPAPIHCLLRGRGSKHVLTGFLSLHSHSASSCAQPTSWPPHPPGAGFYPQREHG